MADEDDPSTVYILDEIGRMELHSAAFASRVEAMLGGGVRLLGAITAPIYGNRVPFCDRVCTTQGVEVHRLTAKVRDEVVAEVQKDIACRWSDARDKDRKRPRDQL